MEDSKVDFGLVAFFDSYGEALQLISSFPSKHLNSDGSEDYSIVECSQIGANGFLFLSGKKESLEQISKGLSLSSKRIVFSSAEKLIRAHLSLSMSELKEQMWVIETFDLIELFRLASAACDQGIDVFDLRISRESHHPAICYLTANKRDFQISRTSAKITPIPVTPTLSQFFGVQSLTP